MPSPGIAAMRYVFFMTAPLVELRLLR
jgi:hypothetical protein